LLCNGSEMIRHILYLDPVKVKYLTTGKNSGENFMFFCRCQDKNSIRRWFFQSFQKCIESRLRKHVHLVNDIDFVFTSLRRDSYLFNQATDIVHRVIRCRIQLVNTEGISLLKRFTALTSATGFYLFADLCTVYCFRQNTGTSCLPHTTRSTKQKSLRQLIVVDRIFERAGNMLLTNNGVEGHRTIFPC